MYIIQYVSPYMFNLIVLLLRNYDLFIFSSVCAQGGWGTCGRKEGGSLFSLQESFGFTREIHEEIYFYDSNRILKYPWKCIYTNFLKGNNYILFNILSTKPRTQLHIKFKKRVTQIIGLLRSQAFETTPICMTLKCMLKGRENIYQWIMWIIVFKMWLNSLQTQEFKK